MSEWSIYWILKLDAIISFMGGLNAFVILGSIIAIIAAIAMTFARLDDDLFKGEKEDTILFFKKLYKIMVTIAFLLPFCAVTLSLTGYMLPTTKEYLIIKGVSYATNNERIATTADKIFDGVEEYIDKKLNEGDLEGYIDKKLNEETTDVTK